MNLYFIIIFLFVSIFSHASDYKLSSPPKELLRGDSIVGFNDECQILFAHSPVNRLELFFKGYLLNPNDKSTIIDYFDRNEWSFVNLFPEKINNNGTVLGRKVISLKNNEYGGTVPFVWQENKGILNYNLSKINSGYYSVNDLNDSEWFIGHYHTKDNQKRPYLCKSSISICDMGENSEFCMHFGKVGYHVTDIELTAINNNGQLAGWFAYGQYDTQKKKYFTIGYETFFWDGSLIHIVPLPYQFSNPPSTIKINNKGSVIIKFDKPKHPYENFTTFFWNYTKGIQEIKGFNGDKINDCDVIIGENLYGVPSIWESNKITAIPTLFDNYQKTTKTINVKKFIDINNEGKILSTGIVEGKVNFFIIEQK